MTTPRGRRFARAAMAALAAQVVVMGGCDPAQTRKPIQMTPIGTVPIANRTVVEPDGGTTTTPNSGTTIAVKDAKESACTSAEFEELIDALKGCESGMPKTGDVPSGMREKLEVRVSASTPSITPGGRVDLTILFRNKSSDPLPLFFSGDPSPRFEVEAVDSKGKRVDLPKDKPPKSPAMPSRDVKASKIVLMPGGTAKVRIPWDAVKTRWAPERVKSYDGRGYARAPAGPLGAGKYTLRIVLPLIGVIEKGELDVPKVPLEISPS